MFQTLSALALSAFAGAGLVAILATVPPEPHVAKAPAFQILATTVSGDSYVAGLGDDCATAWEGARLPSNWVDVVCVPVERSQSR